MTKILSIAAVAALLAVVSSTANARNGFGAGGESFGSSSFSPGQQFRENGPVGGRPGASG
jgi:hypothetical protein